MPDHQPTPFQEAEVQPVDDFTVVRSPDGRWYTVTGPCPTCRARTVFRVAHGVLGPLKGRLRHRRARPEPLTGSIPVYCQCGYPHPDRPPESPDAGCGAFWDVPVPPPAESGDAP
ncbi:hypothetical protein ABZ921_40045 [Streptomyces atriruber]|uniref:Uncharacterized protein n=1 Tax=Streptomyces atriruber TaxID=545121 RepID=A0ABV3C2C6_9ACTN